MAFPPLEPLRDICFWGKTKDKTAYLHKPPIITPNYGQKKKQSILPKTHIARVLLYENAMQDNILDVQLKYLTKQNRNFRFSHRKHRYAFIDTLKHRQKWHKIWETGYQRMKDAFIAQYGTRYMPVPTPEPEVDPFIFNARLAPPINVLTFYLDSRQQLEKKSEKEYLYDHARLINDGDDDSMLYTHSTEDPRFRRLEKCLVPPLFYTDGYNQLSPDYCKAGTKVKKRATVRQREIILPRFYQRLKVASRESLTSRPQSDKHSVQKDSTFPIVEDDRGSTLSELSRRGSVEQTGDQTE